MRVIASQKLPRDSGDSMFAARHQDVSSGPLARRLFSETPNDDKTNFERSSQKKGGRQGIQKEGQQGTHLEILLSA